MPVEPERELKTVLMVGGTGHLGSKVVDELLDRGKQVRALVRPGSGASSLERLGVAVVRGDLTDPASLRPALDGIDCVVTTAIGYIPRRPGDSLESVDDVGNRNLIDASREADIARFVFTSILTADKAKTVPHFWQKKLVEDYLEASGVPFVVLRPGGYIDQAPNTDMFSADLKKGRLTWAGDTTFRMTWVSTHDVARYLARAVDEPKALGQRIDIGCDRPASIDELVAVFSKQLGRSIKLRNPPAWLLSAGLSVAGLFNRWLRDLKSMIAFSATGAYVADTTAQAEIFGDVPTLESAVSRYLADAGILSSAA